MSYNVLSLCDGISGGSNSLRLAGIPVGQYIASEIDKHAIKVTQKNHPHVIQVGDMMKFDVSKLKLRIDLVLSGTPCTSFSVAGKMDGFGADTGQLFFKFCEILHKVRKKNPNVHFLFENVASMKKEVRDTITTYLGVQPRKIDSALVCAQTRKRYYWASWDFPDPEDRGIILQDILEYYVDPKYHLSETILKRINKDEVLKRLLALRTEQKRLYSTQLNPAEEFGGQPRQQNRKYDSASKAPSLSASKAWTTNVVANINKSQDGVIHAITGKAQCISAGHGNVPKVALAGAVRGRYNDKHEVEQQLELGSSKSIALTTVEKDNVVVCITDKRGNIKPNTDKASTFTAGAHSGGNHSQMDVLVQVRPSLQIGVLNDRGNLPQVSSGKSLNLDANYQKGIDTHGARTHVAELTVHNLQPRSGKGQGGKGPLSRSQYNKAYCIDTANAQAVEYDLIIRRLTEIEVCRLQGLSDDYFYDADGNLIISSTQVYKSVGNGWQCDTIAHILSHSPFIK